jgi:hypothetical protein
MTLEKRLAILSGRLVCQNFLQPVFLPDFLILRLQRNGERLIAAGFQPCADDGPTGGSPYWPAMTLEKRLAILSGRLVCQNSLQSVFLPDFLTTS